jgi:hypothetical protein
MDTTYVLPNGTATANGTWFDDPLHYGGVDLYFVGHLHQYTRYIPAWGVQQKTDTACVSPDLGTYLDPKYLVTIISGSPGNQEIQPADCGGPTPNNVLSPTAACSRNYGYGYLTVHNASTATWRWNTTVPIAGSPQPVYADELTLIVNHHGPRA